MSLIFPTISFLSAKPILRNDDNYLFAKTCMFKRIISLFGYEKRLLIDKKSKMVGVTKTTWWFNKDKKEFSFDRILGIYYKYKDFGTSWSVNPFWMGRTDSIEKFSISLSLSNPDKKIDLFDFVGEGSTNTGWEGVFIGDDEIIDFQGSQSVDSRVFVGLLQDALKTEIII